MIRVHPFRAYRPQRGRVSEVACPPYDVIGRGEAAAIAFGQPSSFVNVIRPDMHLPLSEEGNTQSVHNAAAAALSRLISEGVLTQEQQESFYVYRQSVGGRRQTGLVCCVDVDAYRTGAIRKHELTRPDKELDRVEHILATGAHTEPVFLATTAEDLPQLLQREMNDRPLFHFLAKDGVTHSLWSVKDPGPYIEYFAAVTRLYIADGHHRSAAADVAAKRLAATDPSQHGDSPSRRFPAVVYPASDLCIAPYHRLILPHPGASSSLLLSCLERRLSLTPWENGEPGTRGACCVRTPGQWHRLQLPQSPSLASSVVEQLDVHKLQEFVLAPCLGVTDPRIDPRLAFVGGRGADALAAMVDSGEALLAFAMHPTSFSELAAVADAGLVMPPKSTWFEPKPRSGLFVHRFSE